MVRSLRYPYLSTLACAVTVLLALGRDTCLGMGYDGLAQMLLFATVLGLGCCFVLMSCRIAVDEMGISVGYLLSMRYANWDELAALGMLTCNSRRPYLYGMYKGHAEFIYLLHQAPRCGAWGFVAPLNAKLTEAVTRYCPYPVDLTPIPKAERPKGMRPLWQQTALYALILIPSALFSFATSAAMVIYGVEKEASFMIAVGAAAVFAAGVLFIRRMVTTFLTCPAISEAGVSIGRGVYMPWEDVRFAYIHRVGQRFGQISGLFFLSSDLKEASRLSAPPVSCLSMPDTSTLLLAYLTYCPHAPREV